MPVLLSPASPPQLAADAVEVASPSRGGRPAATGSTATAPTPAAGATMWAWSARSGRLRCLTRGPGAAAHWLPPQPTPLADWWPQLPDTLRSAWQAAWQRLVQGERSLALHWTDPQGQAWHWQAEARHQHPAAQPDPLPHRQPDQLPRPHPQGLQHRGKLLQVHGWMCPAPADAAQTSRAQVALVSHELRTPLNAIMGFCALAQHQADPAALRPALHQIDQAAQLMRRVIDDLLDLERLQAGALDLGPAQPLRVSALLARVLALAAGLPARPEVALHASLAAEVPDAVPGHAQRLEQILLNLVANALRHTDTGLVQLGVRRQQRADGQPVLRWSVADTGLGMDLQALDRIAQPFAQVGDDLARRRGGSGLGLVVVQRLLALQGSRLQMASVPGGGTTAWFDLPLPPAAGACMAAGDTAEQPARAEADALQASAFASTATNAPSSAQANAHANAPTTLPCTALLCTPDERLAQTLAVQWQAQGQRLRRCSLTDLQRLPGVALGGVRHWLIDDRLPPDALAQAGEAAHGTGVRLWRVHPCPQPTHRGAAHGTALAHVHAALASRILLADALPSDGLPPDGLRSDALPMDALRSAAPQPDAPHSDATPSDGQAFEGHLTHASGPWGRPGRPLSADTLPVLVVEDNLLNQRVFEGLFQHLGLRCEVAADLAQARALAARGRYALAVVDRELPDGDGLDLLREWQHAQPGRWPAVLASAHLEAEHRAAAQACGAWACLLKPIDAAALHALLVRAGVLAPRGLPRPAPALPDLTPLFLRQRAALLAPVEAAWASGDRPTLQRAVHALRGALALLPGPAQAARQWARQVEEGLLGHAPLASLPVPALLHSTRSLQSAA